jgi:C_GCAxxG_C_C family probable redox protein
MNKELICRNIGKMLEMEPGYACSEAMVIGLGEIYLGDMTDQFIKASCVFRGGVASTLEDICGTLSGALLLISAKYGRISKEEEIEECKIKAQKYIEAFKGDFGCTRCGDLIANQGYNSPEKPCSQLVEAAAYKFLTMMEDGEI